ncbi:MAG TPA: hypothetical protein VGG68_12465 [Caulobacteraceae bacterium]|jgi:hypothetical protein
MMVVLALLAVLLADAPPALPAPIAPASAGKAQCYSPDIAHKVCASLNTYALRPDGQIANTATVMIEKTPAVVITSVSAASVVNGRICTVIKKDDLLAARFTVNGATPGDTEIARLRQAILTGWAALIDHTVCVSYVADGSQFVAHTAFDGLPRPNLDQRVIWVSPEDGWKVGL